MRGHAGAVCLVASGAVLLIKSLTHGDEIVDVALAIVRRSRCGNGSRGNRSRGNRSRGNGRGRERFAGFVTEAGSAALIRHPFGVIGRVFRDHDNRHEAMVASAQFRALSAVGAGFLDAEPGLIDETRYGVFLDGEVGHPPGM